MKFFSPQPDRRWLAWWETRLANLALDIAVVAGCCWAEATSPGDAWGRLAFFTAVPVLLVRRRFPWLPVAVVPLLCLGRAAFVPLTVICYTTARQWGPRWRTLLAVLFTIGCLTVASWDPRPNDGIAYQLFIPAAWMTVPALAGIWMYQRRMLVGALRERARQAALQGELLAERAVTDERRRIAREMHDVVAHRVSTIALQAGALTVSSPDERTAATAEVIRSTSATALTELREILSVLRQDHPGPSAPPEALHGIAPDGSVRDDVAALVRDCVAAGADVHLNAPAELPEVPGTIRRAAYRVAQEGLTNAAKHSPRTRVDIALGAGPGELRLTIANQPGPVSVPRQEIPGAGYGLLGMRERVTLARGTLQTGPTADGGYRVHATFPVGKPA